MLTSLLLPFVLAASPGPAAPPERVILATGGDDPAIQLWISDNRRFLPGDRAKVQVRTREDGYLIVLHADPDGHLRVLFPLDPRDDDFVRGGRKYELRGRAGREAFTVDTRTGRGTVYAAVSRDPLRFDQFVLDDHWDYRQLAPQRLSSDPEQDLNDLVRRMADGSFDYDILTYDVLERVVYADRYAGVYDSYYYDGCGYSYFGCRNYYGSPYSVSIGLFFGRPYYRPYYDPFYASYDPFYDPFFYAPYYYRPVYYYPVYSYPYRGYPYYRYPYRNTGYYQPRYWNQPYTPYRFRPSDGQFADYRDRRYDLRRSVNTIYMPPVVRDRQPANANPIRRVTEDRTPVGATAPDRRSVNDPRNAPAARRAPDRAPDRPNTRGADQRMVQPDIEARRAREPEVRRSILPDSRDNADRRDLPTEVRSPARSNAPDRPADNGARRAVVDRPQPEPQDSRGGNAGGGQERRPEPQFEPRRAEPQVEPRAQPRSEPRPAPQYSPPQNDRGGWSAPPSRSDGGDRGGGSGGSGGGGGDRGGGARRRS